MSIDLQRQNIIAALITENSTMHVVKSVVMSPKYPNESTVAIGEVESFAN